MDIVNVILNRTELARSKEIDDLFTCLLSTDELMTEWSTSAFFNAILSQYSLLRDILFSHPLMAKLIVINPGLQEFLEDDNNLKEVIDVMKEKNTTDKRNKRERIISLIEQKLGKSLTLAPEHVFY